MNVIFKDVSHSPGQDENMTFGGLILYLAFSLDLDRTCIIVSSLLSHSAFPQTILFVMRLHVAVAQVVVEQGVSVLEKANLLGFLSCLLGVSRHRQKVTT